mgnify:CR=1 FL=1
MSRIATVWAVWNKETMVMAQTKLGRIEGDSMEKQKGLDAALGQIGRHFGKGSIMRLGQNPVT